MLEFIYSWYYRLYYEVFLKLDNREKNLVFYLNRCKTKEISILRLVIAQIASYRQIIGREKNKA
jgi:hypothetical protein